VIHGELFDEACPEHRRRAHDVPFDKLRAGCSATPGLSIAEGLTMYLSNVRLSTPKAMLLTLWFSSPFDELCPEDLEGPGTLGDSRKPRN